MKHVTIPSHWTGEDALSVVGFLEEILRAIWRAHGDQMADVLNPDRAPGPALQCSCHLDDELPF